MRTKSNYISPEVEILSVASEGAFAQSGTNTMLQDFDLVNDTWENKIWGE